MLGAASNICTKLGGIMAQAAPYIDSVTTHLQVTVLRDGGVKDISIFDLLVGDVMLFETGDIVPADGIIITGNTIR